MPKFDLTTIGEGQLRLTCNKGERISNAHSLRLTAACSEANVSGLLAQLGRRTSWASKLPTGDLSKRCVSEFRSVGVDLSNIVYTDTGRMALYFMEPGEYPMPGRVIYDRESTPFRSIEVSDFDWDSLLDTRVVFVTGITAALTENTARVVRYFVDQAAERQIDVILDVNYRSLLWEAERAREVLEPIARKSQVVFCSVRDGKAVFGVDKQGVEASRALRELFEVPAVVSTDQINGVFYTSEHEEAAYEVTRVPIVDRPGAGDSFVAGSIHGYLNDDLAAGISYGQRTASYALTHHGDLTNISPYELNIPQTNDIVR